MIPVVESTSLAYLRLMGLIMGETKHFQLKDGTVTWEVLDAFSHCMSAVGGGDGTTVGSLRTRAGGLAAPLQVVGSGSIRKGFR